MRVSFLCSKLLTMSSNSLNSCELVRFWFCLRSMSSSNSCVGGSDDYLMVSLPGTLFFLKGGGLCSKEMEQSKVSWLQMEFYLLLVVNGEVMLGYIKYKFSKIIATLEQHLGRSLVAGHPFKAVAALGSVPMHPNDSNGIGSIHTF